MLLKRRMWLKSLLAGSALTVSGTGAAAQDAFNANLAERIPAQNLTNLEDQLKFGLRAVTPGQLQYVRSISQLAEQGRLPRAMVNLVYRWALERNPNVPLPYFQIALKELAKRRGIEVP